MYYSSGVLVIKQGLLDLAWKFYPSLDQVFIKEKLLL